MNLKIEEAFEDAVASFLASVSEVSLFKGFDETNILTPRAEIEVSGLTFLETLDIMNGQTLPEFAKFDLVVSVRLVTNADEGTSRAEHNSILGDIRSKFLRSADNFSDTNLPDHHIFCISMEGSSQMILGSARTTQTDYAIRASIKELYNLAFAFSTDIGTTTLTDTLSLRVLSSWHPQVTTGNDYEIAQYQTQMSYEQDPSYELPTEGSGSTDNYHFSEGSYPLVIALTDAGGMTEGDIYHMHILDTGDGRAQLKEFDGTTIGWVKPRGTNWEIVNEAGAVLTNLKLKDVDTDPKTDQWVGLGDGRGVDWQILR